LADSLTPVLPPLSLHDALPILASRLAEGVDGIVPSAATKREARCFRVAAPLGNIAGHVVRAPWADSEWHAVDRQRAFAKEIRARSEERRVGKEGRRGGGRYVVK